MPLALAVVLIVAQADAGSSSTVWALGSTVNLRDKPDAKGKLMATAAIGTSCSRLSTQGEWVEVSCPFGSGFAKAELFGAQAPTADELRAIFDDGKRSVSDRLQAAQRLAALGKASAIDRFAYNDLFAKGQVERLRTLLEKRKKPIDTLALHFDRDVSDHQSAMHYQINPSPMMQFKDFDGPPYFTIAYDVAPDGFVHVMLCEVELDKNNFYRRVRVWDDGMVPLDAKLAARLAREEQTIGDPCAPQLLDAPELAKSWGVSCALALPTVTAHSACQLACAASCVASRMPCPECLDQRLANRDTCANACRPAKPCP
jgi:hypothetical protein